MSGFSDWIDRRTGFRRLAHAALFESVPGGARWRYVWGSTLVFCFVVQVVTGLFLWLSYSPSSQTAWESVYYIQHVMWGGWFLRGLHHFTAQAMTVLLVLHLVQVVIDSAYKAPREINYWTGLLLLILVLILSLTGYLLPWDQKGYWATKVATNIVGVTPLIGSALQRLIIGGVDYGHQTLTRFFAVHAGFVPGLIMIFVLAHVAMFRRQGIKAKEPLRRPDALFWPDQLLRDAIACLVVLVAVMVLAIRNHGAPLDAPAEASQPFAAARPEWYFLFLFQWLKYFPGGTEVWGAIVIPLALLGVVAALPLFARLRKGHRISLGILWGTLGGIAVLTLAAVREDRANPDYLAAVQRARLDAERAVELAQAPAGIPPEGAAALMRNDPLTQGPRLFAANCASCHRYDGHDGLGVVPSDEPKASDLKGYGSREWLTGLLSPEKVDSPQYWGGSEMAHGDMADFVRDDVSDLGPQGKQQLELAIMALSAEAHLPAQREIDERDSAKIEEGSTHILGKPLGCTDCHIWKDEGEAEGPYLSGFANRNWLISLISDPAQVWFFGENNDGMPSFGPEKRLTEQQIGVLADWLRGDWYRAEAEN